MVITSAIVAFSRCSDTISRCETCNHIMEASAAISIVTPWHAVDDDDQKANRRFLLAGHVSICGSTSSHGKSSLNGSFLDSQALYIPRRPICYEGPSTGSSMDPIPLHTCLTQGIYRLVPSRSCAVFDPIGNVLTSFSRSVL